MKKTLLFLAAFALSVGLSAQNFEKNSVAVNSGLLQKAAGHAAPATQVVNSAKKGPKRVELGPNQLLLGGYTSDAYATGNDGLGLPSVPGTLKAAIELPTADFAAFNGSKVVKIRVALANSATVTRVFITPATSKGIEADLVSQDVNFNTVGWNEVELTTPVTLNLADYEELLLGFDYTQTSTQTDSSYPLSMVAEGTKAYNSLVYGNLGQGIGWYNLGSSYGNLSIQAFVENENFPEKDIVVNGLELSSSFQKAGAPLNFGINVQNFGTGTINNYAFNVLLDGADAGTVSSTAALAALGQTTLEGSIDLPADIAFGSHTIAVKLATVDGEAPAGNLDDDEASNTFSIYTASVPRQKQLVEHFTSWTCTYCYLGYNILRKMESDYDDIAWVAVHGNQSSQTDPYFFSACNNLMDFVNLGGFPSAAFNRTFISDLAEGDNTLAYGLGYNASYLNQVVPYLRAFIDESAEANPSFVALAIDNSFDPETRQLDVTVSGTGVENAALLLNGYAVNVYLTEEGLTGKQYSNGAWQDGFEHNNTLRALLTSVSGDDIAWDGDNFTYTKSYDVPVNFEAANLSITAFVAPKPGSDLKQMMVNNCERAVVKTVEAGIRTVSNAAATVQDYFTIDGKRLNTPARGLNIVRMSDGTVRKVAK